MSFSFAAPRRAKRIDLTPMIDVVFLLLVFFLLAARFGAEGALSLQTGGGGASYEGPPRLVDIRPEGLALNGVRMGETALLADLARLAPAPDDAVILRAREGASVADLARAMELLREAGHARLLLIE